MPHTIKRRSQKAWAAPGKLMHIGDKKVDTPLITAICYNETTCFEHAPATAQQCAALRKQGIITWINIEGLHDTSLIEQIGTLFDIHPLVLEDILNTDQRPKVDDMDTYLYIVVKMLDYHDLPGQLISEQVSILLGADYLISFQEGLQGDLLEPLRERIRSGKGKIRKMGPDYLAYALIDGTVDNYFVVTEKISEQIELLEEAILAEAGNQTIQTIHHLKRTMLTLKKDVWPMREIISGLARGNSVLIREATEIYLRDVYDHIIHAIDTVETTRDMLSGMLDIYLSSLSNRMNQSMKVLTIIATIFIPLSFIAGVYGMNFKSMPELNWPWGYPLALSVMAAAAGAMVLYFKKKKLL